MKNFIVILFFYFCFTSLWSQNKPRISIINNIDDSLSYYYCGVTIFSNYVNHYHTDFNYKKHINEYIIRNLSDKFDFVEIPLNIDKKLIKPSPWNSKLLKSSRYLIDSLKKCNIEYIVTVENKVSSNPNSRVQFEGWGIIAQWSSSIYYASFSISILSIKDAEFKFSSSYDPYIDFKKCESIKPQKNKKIRLTPEDLSQATDPIIMITDKILVGSLFSFLNGYQK
jgi:hypothetical protein